MFDSIGWGEMAVLALAALFIFGPDRLPGVASDAAAMLRRVRRAVTGLRGRLTETLGEDLPELRDLDVRQYTPKALVRQHLLADDEPSEPRG